jgi:hypothetical protein
MSKAKRLRQQRQQEQSPQESSSYPVGARSFELKMWRASVHLHQLEREVTSWIEMALKTVDEQPDPEGSGYYAAWVTPPAPDHASLSLLAGDCLQCMRAALDHLALELAATFTIPMTDEIEESSEFPIVGDLDRQGQSGTGPRRWRDGARRRVAGADPLAQAAIERLQPYQRGESFEEDLLWRLGRLNNIDKHRTLHVVGMAMEGGGFPVNGPNLLGLSGPATLPPWGSPPGSLRQSRSPVTSRQKAAQGQLGGL